MYKVIHSVSEVLRLFCLLCGLATVYVANAQQWIDVTDSYVKNPRYDNNDYSYWSGTGLGGYNPFDNAEHYNKNYDTYQLLTGLTPGKYRVSLNAFYRMGSSNDDYTRYSSGNYSEFLLAKLYAKSSVSTYTQNIAPSSSVQLTSPLGGGYSGVGGNGWWGSVAYYIPNNMEAAHYWFEAGHYLNTLECEVGQDGQLTIGIRKDKTLSEDWTCIDNWKLEFWGQLTKVTSIELSETQTELTVGEIKQLTYKCLPENATYRNVTWKSSNTNVATVDEEGFIKAIKTGTVTITATATDGSNVKASCRVTIKEAAIATLGSVVINEIMASNIDVYRDPSTNFGSWVELYNPTSKGVKIGGLYVTDDENNLKKHKLVDDYGVIPAKGYAILNFDHFEIYTPLSYRQIDDKLDCDGGTIIVSDGTTILAKQDYPEAIGRVSYARTTDGGDTWATTGNPSPGASNEDAGGFAIEQLAEPMVDKKACVFTGSLSFKVDIPAGTTLKYTTNGTAPTLTNGMVSNDGSFNVSSTTCYRFRLFQEGMLPSKVVTRTFINSTNEPFPIISVVTDPDNISASNDYGLFCKGQYGRVGNDPNSGVCNWNMDWDRPVNFEFITKEGECVVSQECDFSMCGGWSRAWTPHSFKLKATKMYDLQNTFEYQFFDDKPYLNHKTLQIRNGGNDTGCRIKDAAIQQIAATSGIYVDYQAWQPVHVYINGSNHGVLNMREPNNKHFAYSNYGIDTDEMEQFEMSPDSGYVQMVGTGEHFRRLYDLAKSASDESAYAEISNLLDIDEFVNYMAIELYCGCNDWPQNNVKAFRDNNDGKFHFVLFDTDFALGENAPLTRFKNCQYYTFNSLQGYDYAANKSIQGTRYTNKEIEFVTLFLNLLNNNTFKKKFIDAYCLVGGAVYTPERVKSIVSSMANYLATGNFVNPWNTANDIINNFSASRQASMINHLKSYFSLSSTPQQKVVLTSDTEGAKLLVNNMEVPTGKFEGTLFSPITYKAVAPAGYEFLGWSNGTSNGTVSIVFDFGSTWKYADTDVSSSQWKSVASALTSSGSAPLGYDSSNSMKTSLTKNKLTYYFGRTFSLANTPAASDEFTLNYTVDDGFIVYVNGTEAARYNMPSGSVGYNTAATTYCSGNPDNGTLTLDKKLFKKGSNYIAVEVHNNNSTSSDICWDAQLTRTQYSQSEASFVSTEPEYTVTSAGSYELTACFEPIDESKLLAKGTTPVKINEVSAANTMYVNDNFKKKDWIELYNTTDSNIDVAGMYLSDDESNPQKYQIPSGTANTVIAPYGHLIIWADEKEGTSQLHASFKLGNNEGEKVILTSEDGSWSDCLTYTSHLGTQSMGLYPDGSNNVYMMDVPTIGKSNILDSYASFYATYVPEGGGADDPIDTQIAEIPSTSILSSEYYSVSGSYVGTQSANLSAGVYIVKIKLTDGQSVTKKVLVK